MITQIISGTVKVFPHTACMMPEQWYTGVYKPWSPFSSHIINNVLHGIITFFKIITVYAYSFYPFKAFCKFICITRSCFCRSNADTPFIILHQKNYRQLMKCRKLKCFTHFTFCNGGISERTDNHGSFTVAAFFIKR